MDALCKEDLLDSLPRGDGKRHDVFGKLIPEKRYYFYRSIEDSVAAR